MLLWFFNRLTLSPWLEAAAARAVLAMLVALVAAIVLGPWMIAWLKARFCEPNKSDSPQIERLHASKHATPTMGGIFLVAGLLVVCLLFGDLTNPYLQVSLILLLGLATLGAIDDLLKLRSQSSGLSMRAKLAGQLVVATLIATLVYRQHASLDNGLMFHLPLFGSTVDLGLWFVPLAILVMVGSSNAVNLTDGLDGLAGGCLVIAIGVMALLTHVGGNAALALAWNVPHIATCDEMSVVAGGMIGCLLGFLRFNCHPARVFMGDTGSLPLGGLLGFLAIVTRQELLLVLIGGVFVAEAVSVILQVGFYRLRRRRIFRCAPLHHHFQLAGCSETRIVVRFWLASVVCGLIGLACLAS